MECMDDLDTRLGSIKLKFGASIKILGALVVKSGTWRANTGHQNMQDRAGIIAFGASEDAELCTCDVGPVTLTIGVKKTVQEKHNILRTYDGNATRFRQ